MPLASCAAQPLYSLAIRLERAMENSSSSSLIVRAGAVRPTRVGFLVGAELGLLAAQSALGLATLMPSRGVSAG